MKGRRAEFLAGLVVLGAVAVLLGLLFYATGGAIWGDWRYVHLRVEPGELAPAEGDPVFLNGVEVGTVEEVRLEETFEVLEGLSRDERLAIDPAAGDEDGPLRVRDIFVIAVVKLQAERDVPPGTRAEISESITGSRALRLIPSRSARNLPDADTRREPIPVRQAMSLGQLAGRIDDLADEVQALVQEVGGIAGDARSALGAARDLLRTAEARIAALDTEAFNSKVQEAAAGLQRTIAEVETRVKGLGETLDVVAADLRKVSASGVRIAERLEEDVAAVMGSLRQAGQRIDRLLETAGPKVVAFLDVMNETGRTLLAVSRDLETLGPEAEQLLEGVGRDASGLMAVLTEMAHNLLDAAEDLRAHPWKLLNEPSTDQIAYENLRNTMQNYVRALQHMSSTAQVLRDLLARGGATDERTRALLARTLAEFEASLDRYRQMERRLVDLLPAGPGAPASPPR